MLSELLKCIFHYLNPNIVQDELIEIGVLGQLLLQDNGCVLLVENLDQCQLAPFLLDLC